MTMKKGKRGMNRRGFLASAGGAVVLQSLATGIPAKILLDPLSASAEDPASGKILILSCSRQGDPIGANVPGTYLSGGDPNLLPVHPSDSAMQKTTVDLAGTASAAAKPWADLGQGILDRTVFFHHSTNTPVHGDMGRVQRMMDATEKNDMLISLLAREVAPILNTVQSDPLSLGADGTELISSGGRMLGNVPPMAVRQALGGVQGPIAGANLLALRDQHIDEIYKLYRERGTPNQLTLLDAWANSRDQVRSIENGLLGELELIDGNDQFNQARTAAVLAAMNISPVITMHLNFGGDNHFDDDFQNETARHLTAIPTLGLLMDKLDEFKKNMVLKHDVLVGSLNVFGRTLLSKGTAGRDHNKDRHCLVLMGDGIKGGIVGGIELNAKGKDYKAQAIDSATGQADPNGDIPFEDTLGAAGKTLGAAMGVSSARLDEILAPDNGKIVQSVLAS